MGDARLFRHWDGYAESETPLLNRCSRPHAETGAIDTPAVKTLRNAIAPGRK
jgi:hypothetical protein